MQHGCAALRGIAAGAWVVTIASAFTGFDLDGDFDALDLRIWLAVLAIAIVTSLAAMQAAMVTASVKLYSAVKVTAATRPPADGPPTGPLPAVRSIEPYTQRGRHATPARRRA